MVVSRERVLFVTYPFGWGGTEKHLEDLIVRADTTRLEPIILALRPSTYAAALQLKGRGDVPVHQKTASTFREYRRIFAALRPDVIVFVNGKLDLFPWWVYAAARLSGARRVVAIEHLQGEALPAAAAPAGLIGRVRRLIGWRARQVLRIKAAGHLCHRTICVSHAVRRTAVEDYGYPGDRTVTVHNGIDLKYYGRSGISRDEVRAGLGIESGDQLLVYIARLGHLKRIDILLRTVAFMSAERPQLKCMIVGGGPAEKELKALMLALGLADRVRFVGHQADVRPYLEAADVYVTSSEREGFGLALVEAMAYELPCVATNIGGHDEILSTPGTGVLVTPGSAEELALGIAFVLDHPTEAWTMGVAARRVAEERFDIDRMVAQLVDIFLARQ
jgi:glycosyltransferase involved in cell wall biosynthesis